MSTPTCPIVATRPHRRPIRVVGDPHARYFTALRAAGWTVTASPVGLPDTTPHTIPRRPLAKEETR